jgi:RNA polymerase sigma-70 factor (ECF subfamily)
MGSRTIAFAAQLPPLLRLSVPEACYSGRDSDKNTAARVNPPTFSTRLVLPEEVVRVVDSTGQSVPQRSCTDDALQEAFLGYQSELLGMLYHMVGNVEDARDALQETFVKCWRSKQKVPEVRNLKAWVFRIALNTGRDMRQTAWRRRKKPLPEDETSIESGFDSPDARAEHQEQLEMVRMAVRELRAEEQEVFLLRQNGEMTYEEIAEAIGIPTGTVKTRMRLALARLRESLAKTL